jgi:NAD(P)-dependent dehydrogenase (short-subunit alcohol dehydrogenase family)
MSKRGGKMKVAELFDLTGKVAIVTGGSIGLGRQMAEALAEQGANVVIAARKVERCQEVADELAKEFGVKTLAVRCDVGVTEDCENLIAATVKEFGTVDIMVNNAGLSWGYPTLDYPVDKLEYMYKVNSVSTYICAKEAAKVMIEQKKPGKIINVASIGAIQGSPTLEAIGYGASKAAVVSMTKELGVKLAKYNINVNAILPGWFVTHMTDRYLNMSDRNAAIPLLRYGGEDDLKGVAVLLASKASDYMTGQLIIVDGGVTAW